MVTRAQVNPSKEENKLGWAEDKSPEFCFPPFCPIRMEGEGKVGRCLSWFLDHSPGQVLCSSPAFLLATAVSRVIARLDYTIRLLTIRLDNHGSDSWDGDQEEQGDS